MVRRLVVDRCGFCTTREGRKPLTTEDLRWYFDGRAEAAMGVRSSHGCFESMLAGALPDGGGRANGPENAMLRTVCFDGERDAQQRLRVDPVARHRCIRNHRLAHLAPQHLAVLRAAYDGEDWTRLLDEQVGRGPRVELQQRFTHELLQVAPLTALVLRATAPLSPKGAAPAEPVYRAGSGVLSDLRRCLALPKGAAVDRVRRRVAGLARWVRRHAGVRWGEPEAALEALRKLTGAEGDHAAVLRAVRLALAEALRQAAAAAAEEGVSIVVRAGGGKGAPPPPTAQGYILKLLRGGRIAKLTKIRDEAAVMLREARAAAAVVDPSNRRSKRRPRARLTAEAPVSPIVAAHYSEPLDV